METPIFKLKEEIKDLVRGNKKLKNSIYLKLNCSKSTLYRWLQFDQPQSTDYNLLIEIWIYITTNKELADKFKHIKNIENLLTQKK